MSQEGKPPANREEHPIEDLEEKLEENLDTLLQRLARPRVRNPALLAAFAVLAFLLWQSDESRAPSSSDVADLRGEAEPDGFLSGARHLSFNEQGHRLSVISSPRIEQFDDTGTATMEGPDATVYDTRSGTPWKITAESGTMDQGSDRIELAGNVVIARPVPGGTSTLETSRLTVDNARRQVYTNERITLSGPGVVTSATGMQAWIDERTLELNSQVEGRYDSR